MKFIWSDSIRNIFLRIKLEPLYNNAFYFFANTVSGSFFGFLFWWYTARYFESDFVGQAVVIITTAQLITTISNFGLSFSLIRFLPSSGNKSNLINFAFTFVGLATILLSLLILLIGPGISPSLSIFNSFVVSAGFIFFVLILAFYQLSYPILASFRRGKTLFWLSTFAGLSRIGCVMLFAQYSNSAPALIISYSAPMLVGYLYLIRIVLPSTVTDFSLKINMDLNQMRRLLSYSGSSYLGNILHDLPYMVLPHIVANLIGFAAAAYFYIIWQFFGLLVTISNSISLSLFVEGSYRFNNLRILTKRTIASVVVVTVSIVFVVLILAPIILNFFGNDYAYHGLTPFLIVTFSAIPASILIAKIAEFRVKKYLRPVIIAFLIIAITSLAPALFGHYKTLEGLAWFWLFGQSFAALFILYVDRVTSEISDSASVIIAHPMDSFVPDQGGGIRYLMNILKVFSAHGWSILVLGTKSHKRVPTSEPWCQVDISIQNESSPIFWLRYLFLLYLKLPFLKISPTAIIISHRMDCMLPFVIFKPRNPKVMVSASPAYYLRVHYPFFFKCFGWLYRIVESICVQGVNFVVPTDLTTRRYYVHHQPQALLTPCLPSPINLKEFPLISREKARSAIDLPLDTPLVIYSGRLSKVKNLPMLLRAFSQVEQILPDASLIILGAGEEEKFVKSYAEEYCQHVIFQGLVPPEQIGVFYSAADVLVLCSLQEGSPTVIKEALACGTPVVSTDVGDVAKIICADDVLGKIVDPDEHSIAQGMLEFLSLPSQDFSLKQRRRQEVERYSLEEFGAIMLNLCLKVQIGDHRKLET